MVVGAASAVLGLFIGSFLNVVIWRVPRGESVVSPASACPRCGHAIRPWDNLPVLSWLLLRGRCRDCSAPISPRYPAVELATAVLFGLVGLWLGWSTALPAFLYLTALALALVLIDLDVHRLPDALVLPAYPVTAVLLGLASWSAGDATSLLRMAVGGLGLFGLYFVLMVAKPGGMGFGDTKLAGVLGMVLGWLGWGPLVVGAFGAFVIGGVFSAVLMATGRARLSSAIPFGPWMVAGAAAGVVGGHQLWSAYLGLLW